MWHHAAESAILRKLHTTARGLGAEEARRRLHRHGPNVLPREKRLGGLVILLGQLRSPVIGILLFALALTLVLRHWLDFFVIGAVIAINTVVGFLQEWKATKEFEQLRRLVTFKARVLRSGREIAVPTDVLVPGDVVVVRAGDRVPADARLLQSIDLTVVEAPLTGESAASPKTVTTLAPGASLPDRENMLYLGTTIASGEGTAVVCATGAETELGQIAMLVRETGEPPTPLQLKLEQLGKQLTVVVCVIAAIVALIGMLQGRPFLSPDGHPEDSMLYMAVALAVSAIPEGLLVIVTVILAIGMRAILKQGALVHRLAATETLGSTSIICTDKTGTITEGVMRVSRVITADDHYDFHRIVEDPRMAERLLVLKIAALCNDAVVENPDEELRHWRVLGNPTETALLLAAAQVGARPDELNRAEPRLDEIPFRSETKYMATLHQVENARMMYCKGSPERVLQFSSFAEVAGKVKPMDAALRRRLTAAYEEHSRHGLRLLGLAYRRLSADDDFSDPPSGLIFTGFIGLKDPLREETKNAFSLTQRAGIRTVMITGDHRLTAVAIAKEMGMAATADRAVDGSALDGMTDEQLTRRIRSIDIFARVTPKHKLRIVTAWQRRGAVVAMTGDGVNDAPALKAADIGIALNSGTDVAKETADLILLENNFNTIVAVVRQGRVIYDNIRKAVLYLLSDSMAEVLLVTAAMLSGLPLPLLPAQILWINLICDSLPAMALTLEPGEPEVLDEPPRDKREPVISHEAKAMIAVISVAITVPLFALLFVLHRRGLPIDYLRTLIFTQLALVSLIYVFSLRSLRHSIFQQTMLGNLWLLGSVGFGLALQMLAVYEPHFQKVFRTVPLLPADWVMIGVLALAVLGVIEIMKYLLWQRRIFQRNVLSPHH
ncbi:MAG: Ca2+-transporting ATPase [Parcubacteria group bacterium Gr01-1014_31]|nr:MAG: Ca2+-transporting ATPase [Parcubacteria group bacterium Gr01-1014_31]